MESTNGFDNETNQRSGTHPIVGLVVMFCIGVLAGFFGRPIIVPDEAAPAAQPAAQAEVEQVEVQVVVTATPDPNQAAGESGEPEVIVVTATPTPTPDFMADLLADARHFQGEDDAPVTMIEFSDFK